jgi:hypothetical protein
MKKKIKTITESFAGLKKGVVSDRAKRVDPVDDTYLKVNQVSFMQNFTSLIGHYKNNEPSRGI